MNGGRTYAAVEAQKDKRKQPDSLGANRCADLCSTDRRLCSFHRILSVNPVKIPWVSAPHVSLPELSCRFVLLCLFKFQEVNSCLSTT